jgi:hypothetical protein
MCGWGLAAAVAKSIVPAQMGDFWAVNSRAEQQIDNRIRDSEAYQN